MCVCVCVGGLDEWVGVWGGTGMGGGDLTPPSPLIYVRAMSYS